MALDPKSQRWIQDFGKAEEGVGVNINNKSPCISGTHKVHAKWREISNRNMRH